MLNDDYGIPESEPQRERSRPPWIEAIGAITLALLFAALILSSILVEVTQLRSEMLNWRHESTQM